MTTDNNLIFFTDYDPDLFFEDEKQNRYFIYKDESEEEILYEVITYEALLKIAKEILAFNIWNQYEETRSIEESEAQIFACQGDLELFQGWNMDDDNERNGWKTVTIKLDDESKATHIIDLAKRHNSAWYALTRAINWRLTNGSSIANPYIELITDVMLGSIEIPMSKKRDHTKIHRRAYMDTALGLVNRFDLKLTKNDASEHTHSALGVVAEITDLAYGTLKKEVYQRYLKDEL